MVQSHFRVVYDGPAVADGEMDVAQLASSLLALGKLIENVDAIATGEPGRVRVKVQSDLTRGSFDVGIAIGFADHAWQAVTAWATSPVGGATMGALGLLGFTVKDGAKGVIQAVRWLNGRRVAKRVQIVAGNTVLIAEDGSELAVPDQVALLVDDPAVRQPLERFTEPLRDDGVEEIRFEAERGEAAERIVQSEAPAFTAASGAAPTSTSRFPATYQIKRLYFERGKKWRLSNGSQTIMAAIEDESFWRAICFGCAPPCRARSTRSVHRFLQVVGSPPARAARVSTGLTPSVSGACARMCACEENGLTRANPCCRATQASVMRKRPSN